MPIYEFKCTKCHELFEETVPVGTQTHRCPYCGGKSKKQISAVGIIFKGSGFYCTDNRASANGNGKKHSRKKSKVGMGDEKIYSDISEIDK